jgi:uncharacterized protein YndB with AHSA1/START domain
MENSIITLTPRFSASLDRVYRAFVTPADLEQWSWGSIGVDCIADVDVRVGGAMRISTRREGDSRWTMAGTYLDVVPNKKLVHTLQWDAPMGYESDDERVTIEFSEENGQTVVNFTHTGVPTAEARTGHVEGWGNCFETLEKLLAQKP